MKEDRTSALEHQVWVLQSSLDRAEAALKEADKKLSDAQTKIVQAEGTAERAVLERHLYAAALKAGVAPGSEDDVVSRALREASWKVASTGQVYREEDGQPVMLDTKEQQYEPPQAWMSKKLAKVAPWFFGAAQDQPGEAGTGPNPWAADNWNVTKQSDYIAKEGMQKAEKMAQAVGSSVNAVNPPGKSNPMAGQPIVSHLRLPNMEGSV